MSGASFTELFIAGALSGVAEAVTVQPFDMIKTRFQLNPDANPSIIVAMRNIVKEGGVMRLYRGLLPELVGMVPKTSAMYATQSICFSELSNRNGGATAVVAFTAGGLAAIPESLTVTPFQIIKVRLQAIEHLGRYNNSIDCFSKTLAMEGPSAFAIGLGPTLWRNCVWNSIYFGLMFGIEDALPRSEHRVIQTITTLGSGMVGGLIATCFNAPFDVVKSRHQSQVTMTMLEDGTLQSAKQKYRNTFQTLSLIYKEEGYAALYKGFAPKAVRMAIGGGVCKSTFDICVWFMGYPDKRDSPRHRGHDEL